MKVKDVLIIGIVLFVAATAFLAAYLMRNTDEKNVAVIYLNGKEYTRVSLDRDDVECVTIEQDDGCINIIEVFPDGARMKSSTCKNQLCVEQGDVTAEDNAGLDNGRRIVCMPNRIVVEIIGDDRE